MIEDLVNFNYTNPDIYTFGLLFTGIIILYFLIGKAVKKSRMHHDQKRRFMANTRTVFFFIISAAVFILWADELYRLVISLAAILAAFAIAGKEVFLCYGGSFYKTFARPFSVGDRIQVGHIRGDVVDIGLLSTQLLEVGPKDYTQQLTGRTITIPNSMFLSHHVYNETDNVSEGRGFVLHIFQVPIKNDHHWEAHRDTLLQCANKACEQYIERARSFFTKLAAKRNVGIPLIEPRINIRFDEEERILLLVRISVPVEKRGMIEQEIIHNYLKHIYKHLS